MEQSLKIEMANKADIEELTNLRVLQQKDEWQEEYEDKMNLKEITETYLNKHLNNDIYFFVVRENNKIVATCGLQIIEQLP